LLYPEKGNYQYIVNIVLTWPFSNWSAPNGATLDLIPPVPMAINSKPILGP